MKAHSLAFDSGVHLRDTFFFFFLTQSVKHGKKTDKFFHLPHKHRKETEEIFGPTCTKRTGCKVRKEGREGGREHANRLKPEGQVSREQMGEKSGRMKLGGKGERVVFQGGGRWKQWHERIW